MKYFVVATLMCLGFSALSQNANQKLNVVKDVETLNDDINKYSGQRVEVQGEIKDKVDGRSVILESGGILNDEIVVITGPNYKGNLGGFKEDTMVKVTGTVIAKPYNEIRSQYNWTLNEDMQTEFGDVRAFLVADDVQPVKR